MSVSGGKPQALVTEKGLGTILEARRNGGLLQASTRRAGLRESRRHRKDGQAKGISRSKSDYESQLFGGWRRLLKEKTFDRQNDRDTRNGTDFEHDSPLFFWHRG